MSGPPGPADGYSPDVYYAPGWEAPAPRVEPLAVAAVPAGLALGPVGVALGAVALSRVRAHGTRGRGLAVAGVVLGVLVTVAWVVVAVLAQQVAASRVPLSGEVTEPRTVHAQQVVLGTCLDTLPDDGEVTRVQAVPCAGAHRAQVVARTDFGTDAVWPGQAVVDRQVARVCTPSVLGTGAPEGLRLVVWAPSESSWSDGDRTGLCLASSSEPLTGSLLD